MHRTTTVLIRSQISEAHLSFFFFFFQIRLSTFEIQKLEKDMWEPKFENSHPSC